MSLSGKLCLAFSGFSLIIMVVTTWILGGWLPFLYIFLGLFGLGLILAIVVDYRLYLSFLMMKTAKNGISMGLSILLTILFCVSVAYLSTQFEKSFDITEEQINSLAPQTIQLLDQLEEDLYVKVFYKGKQGMENKENIKRNLFLFKQTSSKLKDRYYNAHLENTLAQKYLNDLSNKDKDNIFVFIEYKGRKVQVSKPFNEEKITSAIIQTTRRGERSVYFLSGHGERDPFRALSSLREALTQSSFQVKTLNFIKDGFSIPPDAAALLIVGPNRLLLPQEIKTLRQFLQNGGHMLLALDPDRRGYLRKGTTQPTQKASGHSFSELLSPFGVNYTGHYLASRIPAITGLGPLTILGLHFDRQSPITRSFEGGSFIIFNVASNLKINNTNKDITITELVKTNVNIVSVPDLQKNQLTGERTSHIVGLLVKRQNSSAEKTENKIVNTNQEKKDTLLAVFGDSNFMTNPFFHTSAGWNKDLIMNTISWLVDESDLISIRPKKLKATQLILKQSDKMGMILFSIILPCILFIVGGILWFRRRGA